MSLNIAKVPDIPIEKLERIAKLIAAGIGDSEDSLLETLLRRGGEIYWVEYEGEPVAVAVINLVDTFIYYISMVAVENRFRNKGLAKDLLATILDSALSSSAKVVFLARTRNLAMLRLFRSSFGSLAFIDREASDVEIEAIGDLFRYQNGRQTKSNWLIEDGCISKNAYKQIGIVQPQKTVVEDEGFNSFLTERGVDFLDYDALICSAVISRDEN